MKPENVLCSDIDHVSPVKLCDLDLASKASPPSPPRLTNVNSEPDLASPVGSAEFMAPEVCARFYIIGSNKKQIVQISKFLIITKFEPYGNFICHVTPKNYGNILTLWL